jgi:hypothetical protein
VKDPTHPDDGRAGRREPRPCNCCTDSVPPEPTPQTTVVGVVSASPERVGTENQLMRTLWLPEKHAFDQAELEWQMMRRGFDPVQLAEVAGVNVRTLYRALSGHRTLRRNAIAILTALNRAPVAIPA